MIIQWLNQLQISDCLLPSLITLMVLGLVCADQAQDQTPFAFVNVLTRGDLSTLRWIASPLRHFQPTDPNVKLCKVYYASLNFRDIMLATGKLPPDAIPGKIPCGYSRNSNAQPM